jgi:hypothetical protein
MGDATKLLQTIQVETTPGRIKQWHGLSCRVHLADSIVS